MKSIDILLTTVLVTALTMPLLGQHHRPGTKRNYTKKHDITVMMGKPTVDSRIEGVHMKVWVMNQKRLKPSTRGKVIKTRKHDNATGTSSSVVVSEHLSVYDGDDAVKDEATTRSTLDGTHRIMVDLTDAATGKEIANASAKVLITSPSKSIATVFLKPMMGDFGGLLTLEDKGEYLFTVVARVGGVAKTKRFQFAVK
jgi:hypothetical protein